MVEAEDKLTLQEVARQLNRSLEQVRRYVREGKLPAQKLGMQWFVKRSALEAFKSRRPFAHTQGSGGATKEDVLARAWALRERIRKRVGWFDVVELLEESRRNHPFEETEDSYSAGVYPEPFDSAQGRLHRSTEDKPSDSAQDKS